MVLSASVLLGLGSRMASVNPHLIPINCTEFISLTCTFVLFCSVLFFVYIEMRCFVELVHVEMMYVSFSPVCFDACTCGCLHRSLDLQHFFFMPLFNPSFSFLAKVLFLLLPAAALTASWLPESVEDPEQGALPSARVAHHQQVGSLAQPQAEVLHQQLL